MTFAFPFSPTRQCCVHSCWRLFTPTESERAPPPTPPPPFTESNAAKRACVFVAVLMLSRLMLPSDVTILPFGTHTHTHTQLRAAFGACLCALSRALSPSFSLFELCQLTLSAEQPQRVQCVRFVVRIVTRAMFIKKFTKIAFLCKN